MRQKMQIDRLRNLGTPRMTSCCSYDKHSTYIETRDLETKYLYVQLFYLNYICLRIRN